jgi:hypothetical protein
MQEWGDFYYLFWAEVWALEVQQAEKVRGRRLEKQRE